MNPHARLLPAGALSPPRQSHPADEEARLAKGREYSSRYRAKKAKQEELSRGSASEGPARTDVEEKPTEPVAPTEESKEEGRKRQNREAVARSRARKKREIEVNAQAQERASMKARHEEACEDTLARLKKIAASKLTEDHIKVFGGLFDDGDLLEGESDFPRDGEDEGLKNGWFFARLRAEKAPAASGKARPSRDPVSFWTDGRDRLDRLTKVFKACVAAGIALVVEEDAPEMSVMGICAQETVKQGYVGLGSKGRMSTRESFQVDDHVVNKWLAGCVREDCLGGHTWLLRNHKETKRIEKSKKLWTIQSRRATELIENTGMARMCFPGRSGADVTINNKKWEGGEVESWAMSPDGKTKLHLDMQESGDRLFFAAAVGMVQAVRKDDLGLPFAKRAIVVCAQDREKVVAEFRLNVHDSGHCQYSRDMDLEGLARRLGEIGARFVVMNFRTGSSYLLPPECAHMFENACLTESSGWYPCVPGYHYRRLEKN